MPSTGPYGRGRNHAAAASTAAIPATTATHLRLEVVASQCTGGPDFAGQQTNDPNVPSDCTTGSAISGQVRAAEFQVYAH